jgi:hypothetical protein
VFLPKSTKSCQQTQNGSSSGGNSTFSSSINGNYDRAFENGSELYVNRSDKNKIIEHIGDKWRVKPASTKGQGNCIAWVAGACPLENCAVREWSVLDGDVWSVAPNITLLTGRTWLLLKSLLNDGSGVIKIPHKRSRTVKVTYAAACATACMSIPIEPPPRVINAKSAKAEAAHFSDFFSRMSQAKALNDQALVMAAQSSSSLPLLATPPRSAVALERPRVDPFEPKSLAPATLPNPSESFDCHGACSPLPNILKLLHAKISRFLRNSDSLNHTERDRRSRMPSEIHRRLSRQRLAVDAEQAKCWPNIVKVWHVVAHCGFVYCGLQNFLLHP